eukprot:jgi/Mesvir1/5669/Mv15687-RA.1
MDKLLRTIGGLSQTSIQSVDAPFDSVTTRLAEAGKVLVKQKFLPESSGRVYSQAWALAEAAITTVSGETYPDTVKLACAIRFYLKALEEQRTAVPDRKLVIRG